ncbi:ferroxidase fet3 [Geranomyces variabilis]|uniref:Ferroxidase fet3 n=1 Tax=Geranomyces variabilis TaxID=109894 RepID=A0AAD5THY9_9FUNG|nr:ferroxidase fet3 [Geranomyces variabilis]
MRLALAASAAAAVAIAATGSVGAATTYNLEATYVDNVNPSNTQARRVIGINGAWPPPLVVANYNDSLTVNVKNSLDVPTSMHSHGIFFKGQNYLDGAAGVTQCGIPPGESFTYQYVPQQWGTYWYHAHINGQYVDGFRGPLIIRPPTEVYKYDAEYIVVVGDWYHKEYPEIMRSYAGIHNPTGSEPPPDSVVVLIHDGTKYIDNMTFAPGKTYRLRLINMSAFTMYHISIGGHTMDVIEVDGEDTNRKTTGGFWLSVASRWSVLVTAKNTTDKNYQMDLGVDTSMFAIMPPTLQTNYTTPIIYNPASPLDATPAPWEELDDMTLEPHVVEPSTAADQSITLDVRLDMLDDGINHGMFNEVSYSKPKVPTIFTAVSTGGNASKVDIYGTRTNAHVLESNKMIQVIINNNDAGSHPFHLHGHRFQIVARNDSLYDPSNPPALLPNPVRRDIVQVPPLGSAVLQFRADNPGVWAFHCHIEWHMATGLFATFIEAPLEMQQSIKIPQVLYDQCNKLGTPSAGNAAGNLDVLDMTGEVDGPNVISGGWDRVGKIALAFTILAALLGLATVVWFGST